MSEMEVAWGMLYLEKGRELLGLLACEGAVSPSEPKATPKCGGVHCHKKGPVLSWSSTYGTCVVDEWDAEGA